MRFIKIKEMSVPGAMLLSALIVGLSIFITTWIFFGGDNNRQKLFIQNPSLNRNTQQNTLTPQQLQQIQQQRAAMQNASGTPGQIIKVATTTPVKK